LQEAFFCAEAFSVEKPVSDAAVTIDAAVTQERPIAADIFEMLEVALTKKDFFLVMRGFNEGSQRNDPPQNSKPLP